ncbi:hypothetical protein [Nocardia sp. NPDC020380]|uniref:hypothetical protein n=1 Tax=Nocardia sp. NPDC020380 TaxID=3364309 RepID=UPI00378DF606
MKHRKPSRIKASTSLTLAGAAAVVSLLSAPANAAPADPGVVPADQQQPGDQPPTTDPAVPAPDPSVGANPAPKPDKSQPAVNSQPGVTTPGAPTVDPNAPKQDPGQPQGATQPEGPNAPKTTDPNAPKADPNAPQQAGVGPQQANPPKTLNPSQPGVTVPREAPLPVPGQAVPVQVQQQPGQQTVPNPSVPNQQPGQQQPNQQQPQQPGQAEPAINNQKPHQDPDSTVVAPAVVETPKWQAPAVNTAPAAPVVQMNGPHTEVGANIDGGALAPGWAANTHHFSNLDGYVGTVGYTTPGGSNEAGVSLDFTTVNRIKVTAFAGTGADNDQKMEFVLDTTLPNEAKANAENWIRLMPGGATVLDAAAQIGKLPAGEYPAQTVDVGGLTTQVGGSVQN